MSAPTTAVAPSRTWTWQRIAVVIGSAAVAIGAAFGVWFAGLDPLWAVATVLVVGPVVVVLATVGTDDDAPWEPPARETPRGVRITVAILEESLLACDRLARPSTLRQLRALAIVERNDRLARLALVRRMRALLVTELHAHGLDATHRTHDDAMIALLGPDAFTILQPNDDTPVTTAAIERCLDAVERLGTEPPRSR